MLPPPGTPFSTKRARISDPIPGTSSWAAPQQQQQPFQQRLLPVHHSAGCCTSPSPDQLIRQQQQQQQHFWHWQQQQARMKQQQQQDLLGTVPRLQGNIGAVPRVQGNPVAAWRRTGGYEANNNIVAAKPCSCVQCFKEGAFRAAAAQNCGLQQQQQLSTKDSSAVIRYRSV